VRRRTADTSGAGVSGCSRGPGIAGSRSTGTPPPRARLSFQPLPCIPLGPRAVSRDRWCRVQVSRDLCLDVLVCRDRCRRVQVVPLSGFPATCCRPCVPATRCDRGPLSSRPDVTAAPRPDVTAAPRPDVTAAPRPDVTAAPRPDVTVAPCHRVLVFGAGRLLCRDFRCAGCWQRPGGKTERAPGRCMSGDPLAVPLSAGAAKYRCEWLRRLRAGLGARLGTG
jgi:hypothetical protein